jgi:hypothetical protein
MCKNPRFALLLLVTLPFLSCGDCGSDVTEPAGSITVSAAPASVNLTPGSNVTVGVSIARSNFDGTVSLSLAGAPSGVTGSFSPASLASGSSQSTLSLAAAASAATGGWTLTVRASGTGVPDASASLALVVEAAPAYALSAPGSVSLEQGKSTDVTITIDRTNFTGAVSLSVVGAPAGLATSVSPAAPTGAAATLTLDAAGDPAPGLYPLTVRGQAQELADRTAPITLTVTPKPVTITSPGNQTAVVGQPFSLALGASGPGTLGFALVDGQLPFGLTLNAATGAISGMPTVDALLTGSPAGSWTGIVIEVSNGTQTARTDAFAIDITGVTLPAPYAYMPFDGTSLDDVFGRTGTAIGSVTPGQPGAIGEAVRVNGPDSYILYPTTLGSRLNDKGGFTFVATIATVSSGTMFFGLSDATSLYSRAYAGLIAGVVEFGGRSARFQLEEFQDSWGTTTVNDGQFHTVMGVMDLPGDRFLIYVDGKQNAERNVAFTRDTFEPFTPAADGNIIGHITGYADSSMAPDIRSDEFALWDSVLDAYQAATLRWLILTGKSIRSWIGF